MKERSFVIAGLILFVFAVISAGLVHAAGPEDDHKIIKEKLSQLGFEVDKITKVADRTYAVDLKGFEQRTGAVSLEGGFRNFTIQVSVIGAAGIKGSGEEKTGVIGDSGIKGSGDEETGIIGDYGILIKDKAKLEKAGFRIKIRALPSGIHVK